MVNQQIPPSLTPNVVVNNPMVRKVANVILGVAALALPILGFIDLGSEGIAFTWLPVAAQINLFLIGAFNLSVINPNIPTANAVNKALLRRDLRGR